MWQSCGLWFYGNFWLFRQFFARVLYLDFEALTGMAKSATAAVAAAT